MSLATAMGMIAAPGVRAQTETVLHSFAKTGTDGYYPVAALVLDAKGNMYGTTQLGGASGVGTVFKVTAGGTETVLHSFANGADGSYPDAPLLRDSKGNLYGTASEESDSCECGTVFEISASGTEKTLYTFSGGTDGNTPYGALVRDLAGNFYGTTYQGGTYGVGNVFELTTSGVETTIYNFTGGVDGGFPIAGLVRDSAGNLYGTTDQGGAKQAGVVFKVTPSGTETVLHSFCSAANCTDGAFPDPPLIRDVHGNLYGVAINGGTYGSGVVFKVTAGGKYIVLYSFTGGADGKDPAGLTQNATTGNLYGTTGGGGASGYGTVFELTPAGTETVLYSFTGGADGNDPLAGPVLDAQGNLYGTTASGGASGGGTVFKVVP